MPNPTDKSIWEQVRSKLSPHAYPDSRFHQDFSVFIPDFRGSSSAADRIADLDCYKTAKVLFCTPDNSLQSMRYRALKDGKKLLVGTYGLRRGFLILDPHRIEPERLEYASSIDGMERPGIGCHVTLAKLQEEGIQVDLYIAGSWAVSDKGITLWKGNDVSTLSWHILADMHIMGLQAPTLTLVHSSQVVEEGSSEDNLNITGNDFQYDFVVTEHETIRTGEGVSRPLSPSWLDSISEELLHTMPPLQELKGIKVMERIMRGAGMNQLNEDKKLKVLNPEEQLGVDIVTRLMKGYKV